MIVYDTPVLVTGALATGSSGHQGATPRMCGGHLHHHFYLLLSTILKIKYVVKHKSAKLFMTYAVGKLEAALNILLFFEQGKVTN